MPLKKNQQFKSASYRTVVKNRTMSDFCKPTGSVPDECLRCEMFIDGECAVEICPLGVVKNG